MKTKKNVWIPAILAAVIAMLFLAFSYYMTSSQDGRTPYAGASQFSAGRMHPLGGERPEGSQEVFKTLGTISVILGAICFSWLWFKKKLKSPSMLVRKIGKLLYSVHKWLGWACLIVIAVHGSYFMLKKPYDHNIYTGLAASFILLMIVGYGFFINKIRNKWMRSVHRTLGLLWVPILLLHAGGSVIAAVIASLGAWALVAILERNGEKNMKPISGDR